jgi:hypothetical protein
MDAIEQICSDDGIAVRRGGERRTASVSSIGCNMHNATEDIPALGCLPACSHTERHYLLDGRDPNGYAGIASTIIGKHERAWSDRPIYGKIRYLSFASTSRKFDSKNISRKITASEK